MIIFRTKKNSDQSVKKDYLLEHGLVLGETGSQKECATTWAPSPSGVFLGAVRSGGCLGFGKRESVTYIGGSPILAVGRARAGFTTCIAIPTLLSAKGQYLVAPDINGEYYKALSGCLKDAALKFDPASEDTVHYNPLEFVRIGTEYALPDIMHVAHALIGDLDTGWVFAKMASTVIVDAIQQVFAEGERLHDAVPSTDQKAVLEDGMNYSDLRYANPDITLNAVYRLIHDTPEKLDHLRGGRDVIWWSGVINAAESILSLFAEPTVAAATADCEGLRSGYRKGIFLVAGACDVQRFTPLFRVIVEQQLRDGCGGPTLLHGKNSLIVLDDFPMMGYLPSLHEALIKRGLQIILHTHCIRGIHEVYGVAANNILKNCVIRVYLSPPILPGDEGPSHEVWKAIGADENSAVIYCNSELATVVDKVRGPKNKVCIGNRAKRNDTHGNLRSERA